MGTTDGGKIFQIFQEQKFGELNEAAVACMPADHRGQWGPILDREEQKAGQGPRQYTEFTVHVLWLITGRKQPDLWMAPPAPQDGNLPTVTEVFSAGDYQINVDGGSMAQPAHLWQAPWNGISASGMPIAALLASITTRALEWTFSMDITSPGGNTITAVTQAMDKAFYLPLAVIAIALAGLYILFKLRREQRWIELASMLGWTLFVAFFAAAFIAQPLTLTKAANGASLELAQGMLVTGAAIDPSIGAADETQVQGGNDGAVRVYVDRWWMENVYDPWTLAEFGTLDPTSPDGKRPLGVEVLIDQDLTGGTGDFTAGSNGAQTLWNTVTGNGYTNTDFQNSPTSLQQWFDGDNAFQRTGYFLLGMLAFWAALLMIGMVLVVVLASQLGLLIGVFAAVPIFVVALHPSEFGKGLFMRWLEWMLRMLGIRIAYALVLALWMVLQGVAVQGFAQYGYGVVAVVEVVLAVLMLFFYRRMLDLPSDSCRGLGAALAADASGPTDVIDRDRSPTSSPISVTSSPWT